MRISDWSSDVCSSDLAGRFEREFETQVAGVRMRAPMMSIHTVAAGGGSILHFDGARLRVGPDSAGANRSEERRVGKGCVSTCRSRWSPDTLKQKYTTQRQSSFVYTTVVYLNH